MPTITEMYKIDLKKRGRNERAIILWSWASFQTWHVSVSSGPFPFVTSSNSSVSTGRTLKETLWEMVFVFILPSILFIYYSDTSKAYIFLLDLKVFCQIKMMHKENKNGANLLKFLIVGF